MDDRWKCVTIAAVERFPEIVKNADVPIIQQAAGQEPANKENVRSHVHIFAKAGLYEKVAYGCFRATQQAADLIGIPLGEAKSSSPKGEPGSGQPRFDLNNLESVEAVDAARKAGGT